jgi:carboxypeptidase PM20D1
MKTLPTLLIALSLASAAYSATPEQSAYYQEPYQQKALEIHRKSISWRTAEGHGLVPTMANYLAEQFLQAGFPSTDVHVLPFTLASGEKTAGLVVRYRGDDSLGEKPILLLAHMDVVDALPKDWERDPFTLIEENGYFFGRGSLDDKFGTTMLTATFLRLRAEGFVPGRDLIIAFTGDEETGMVTTRKMVTDHRDLTDAEFALNADGGGGALNEQGNAFEYIIQTSEKSYASFELTTHNPGGHSSMPRKDNAIYELADALKAVQGYAFPVRYNDTTLKYFDLSATVTPGSTGKAMARFASKPTDAKAAAVLSAEPSLVGMVRTTCVATMLSAGHAENALPQSATATVNCRIFPGVTIADVQTTLATVVNNDDIEIAVLNEPVASPASPLREDVWAAVTESVHRQHPDIPVIPYQSPYATDGKQLRIAGIPTYGVMGLFIKSDDMFAHGLNERVPVQSFYQALEHWYVLLMELAGRADGAAQAASP